MHKSELKIHPTLIIRANMEYKLKIETIETQESNFEIDSTFHYRDSIALQYLMYITMRY